MATITHCPNCGSPLIPNTKLRWPHLKSCKGNCPECSWDEDKLQDILDNLVHDAKSQEASAINNEGPYAQVKYLMDYHGSQALANMLSFEVNGA